MSSDLLIVRQYR